MKRLFKITVVVFSILFLAACGEEPTTVTSSDDYLTSKEIVEIVKEVDVYVDSQVMLEITVLSNNTETYYSTEMVIDGDNENGPLASSMSTIKTDLAEETIVMYNYIDFENLIYYSKVDEMIASQKISEDELESLMVQQPTELLDVIANETAEIKENSDGTVTYKYNIKDSEIGKYLGNDLSEIEGATEVIFNDSSYILFTFKDDILINHESNYKYQANVFGENVVTAMFNSIDYSVSIDIEIPEEYLEQ